MITDEELKHPNNKLWQKQSEKRWNENTTKLKANISELSVEEIIAQKNIILEMQYLINRVGELKGIV